MFEKFGPLPILLGIGCLATLVAARPQAPAEAQKAAVRVTTRLVEVNVVVQDKKGEPVSDLTPDDFEVTEQGKVQELAVFSQESNLNPVGREVPLRPNTFSNMPSREGATQNLVVVLFDTLNTPIEDQTSAKRAVLAFLRQIRPQDRIAIYGLGTSLRVIHDFTGNSATLARAIENYSSSLSVEQAGSRATIEDHSSLAENKAEANIIAAMDEVFNAIGERIADYYIERRTGITLQALEAISGHLASLPGRKCLVWLSAGFPLSYGSSTRRINQANDGVKNSAEILSRAARSITNANVAIYPVDARGLTGLTRIQPSLSTSPAIANPRASLRIDNQTTDEVISSHGTLQELADQTGGRASYNSNDAQTAIRQALEDSRLTYTLGYYPSDANFDGKFRSIRVSVKRPGLQLKYRRGYFAFPDDPLDDAHRRKALSAAASAMLDTTGIIFSAELGRPAPGSFARHLVMEVDAKSIKFEPENDTWSGSVEVMLVQFDGKGKVLKSSGRQVPLQLREEDHQQVLQHGLALNSTVQLKDNCSRLRIILRDVKTGATGSVTAPLAEVP